MLGPVVWFSGTVYVPILTLTKTPSAGQMGSGSETLVTDPDTILKSVHLIELVPSPYCISPRISYLFETIFSSTSLTDIEKYECSYVLDP